MKRSGLFLRLLIMAAMVSGIIAVTFSSASAKNKEKKESDLEELQKQFEWWPTDAKPAPVKDEEKGGYWWWPDQPGESTPWGNRGYIYVHKIIFDYMEDELPPPEKGEMRPSLLIKKIHKNIKVYFDYDSAQLRDDALRILEAGARVLKRNPGADILLTGNCDRRGSEAYNLKLGQKRAEAVKEFMIDEGIDQSRIRTVSQGKLAAIAPVSDILGMQKERNVQFMIAEVEEVMIPYPGDDGLPEAEKIDDQKFLLEQEQVVESQPRVSTREYQVKKNDTLSKIAQIQMGGAHRWKYLYEFNKDRIKNPDRLIAGTVILIPVEQESQFTADESVVYAPAVESRTVTEEDDDLALFEEEVIVPAGSKQVSVPASSSGTYLVQKNDTLWKIAAARLGSGARWKEIYELNRDVLKSPEGLKAGQKLRLP